MSIPYNCWDKVVKYLGVEAGIKKMVNSRDWRFEVARADINRLRFIHRCIKNESCSIRYNWAVRRCKDYCLHLKHKHLRPDLLRRIMHSELICKFNIPRALTNQRHQEHVYYLRQYITIKRMLTDQHRYLPA